MPNGRPHDPTKGRDSGYPASASHNHDELVDALRSEIELMAPWMDKGETGVWAERLTGVVKATICRDAIAGNIHFPDQALVDKIDDEFR